MLHFHAMYEKDLNYACHIQVVANTALAWKKKKRPINCQTVQLKKC